jgi:predicted Zn-dependent peptidase
VALDSLGARPELYEDAEGAAIGLEVRSQHVEEALDVLAQMVQQPRLSEADFALVRARAVDELAGRMAAPLYAGRRALREVVYGADHPHGRPPEGTPETLRALTRADVVDFHRRHIGPRTLALVLAGRVTPAQALRWARQHFGSFRAPALRAPPPPPPPPRRREAVHVVPRPGLAQTLVILGRSVAQEGDPLALQQASRLAGGGIGRRLREAWGASYGATTTLEEHRGEALFSVAAAVQAEHGGAALEEALRQLDRLRQRGIEALDIDREGGRGALALYQVRATSVWRISARYSGLGTSAQAAAALFLLELPASFHAQQIRRAQSLLGAELQAACAGSFDPAEMQAVLVGDPALIRAQVQGPLREVAAGGATAR